MTWKAGRRMRAVLALCTALSLSWLSGTAAHAFLVNTLPRAGARFSEAPRQLALQFSEPVSPRSAQVRVRALKGDSLEVRELHPGADARNLLATLPSLKPGVSVVSWQVVAADGHLSSGEFAFGVGSEGAIPGVQDNVDRVPLPWVTGSALLLVGLALALGGWISERYVWRGQSVPRAWIGVGTVLAVRGGAVHLVSLIGSGLQSVGTVLTGRPGIAAVLALLAFLVSALMAGGRARPFVGLPLGVGALAVAWQGHLGNAERFWFTPLGLAHLLLAAVWVGALVHLAQVLWSGRAAGWTEGIRAGTGRYAGLAAWTVGPLLLLGLVLAWPKFAVPDELWTTQYGRLLLAKVAAALAALALAWLARTRAMPSPTTTPSRLSRLVPAEAAALLGVLLLSAGLVNATPPQALTAANILGAPPAGAAVRAADQVGFLSVYVTAAEGELRVQVAQPTGKPGEKTRVWVSGKGPAGSFTLYPRSCGRGCFRAPYEWKNGETTVQVRVTDPEWPGGTATVKLRWPPGPDQAGRLARVVEAMKRAGTFTVAEQALNSLDPSPHAFPLTAQTLAATDLYLGGGAEDVREVGRDEEGHTVLSLFVPGSSIWYELHVDGRNRIRRERVVGPSYAVQREIAYPPSQKGDLP